MKSGSITVDDAGICEGGDLKLQDVAELTALVSAYSGHFIERVSPISESAVRAYWARTTRRLNTWASRLHRSTANETDDSMPWERIEPTLNAVFVTEMLTRVVTAVVVAMDSRQLARGESIGRSVDSIAQRVYSGHLKLRHMALSVLVHRDDIPVEGLLRVDQIRRRSECWTDLLLGYLATRYQLEEFAFDPMRARESAQETAPSRQGSLNPAWLLIRAGIEQAFADTISQPPDDRMNEAVAGAVLSMFPSDAFDHDGTFSDLRRLRIARSSLVSDRPAPLVLDELTQLLKRW